jgi:hypothetical protein
VRALRRAGGALGLKARKSAAYRRGAFTNSRSS